MSIVQLTNISILECKNRRIKALEDELAFLQESENGMLQTIATLEDELASLRNPPSYRKMDMSDKDYIRSLEQRLAQTEKPE